MSDTEVPPVVAVVVACDPGPWFDEAIASLVDQDYPALSILVIDTSVEEGVAARVAEISSDAFVRRVEPGRGFAASANEALGSVEGASHLLFCHDDVALAPDAVHMLVEESFRSNAAVVAPKLVAWDDPGRLLHVGMAVDKSGAVVDSIEPYEIDHGQHDAVRDVFLAPGGCLLVREDIFRALGGFDPVISAMGEDLDFCWRAQLAGGRVVVAPAAVARHLEETAGSRRPPPSVAENAPNLQALQRRHELRTVLKAYSGWHLLRVLPQILVLGLGEMVVGLLSGHPDRARAVAHAWRWNFSHRLEIRALRPLVKATRQLPDSEVRRLQVRGSARLTAYARRALVHGLGAAHLGNIHAADLFGSIEHNSSGSWPSDPGAGSQDWDLGDWSGGGGSATVGGSRWSRPGSLTPVFVAVVAAVIVLVGLRGLVGARLPQLGQFVPFPNAWTLLHRYFVASPVAGDVTNAPTSPAAVLIGLLGALLGGSTGWLQAIAVIGSLPLALIGMIRLTRGWHSANARLAACIGYFVVPLFGGDMAGAQWAGLVALASTPWFVCRIMGSAGVEPWASSPEQNRSSTRAALSFGFWLALVAAFSLQALVLPFIISLGLAAGTALQGDREQRVQVRRMLRSVASATAVAVLLISPWLVPVLASGDRWASLFGVREASVSALSWGSIAAFALPLGSVSNLAWGLGLAGFLALLLGKGWRWSWAVQTACMTLVSWLVVWAGVRGWLGPVSLSPAVGLAPAAVGVALGIGLGVKAMEVDLARNRLGWLHVATAMAAVFVLVGMVPTVAASLGGRFGLPSVGYDQATNWMPAPGKHPYQVMWLGDPNLLPGGSSPVRAGLSMSVSDGPFPDAMSLWGNRGSDPGDMLDTQVSNMELGQTVQFGEELAKSDVRYVVVVNSLSPFGSPTSTSTGDLVAALNRQPELELVIGQSGFDVYKDQTLPESGTQRVSIVSPERLSLSLVQVIAWVAMVWYLTGWSRRLRARRRNRLSSSRSEPVFSPDGAGVASSTARPGGDDAVDESPGPPGAAGADASDPGSPKASRA